MNTQVFMALSVLNDLKAAAFEALTKKHRGPGLLLLYSFMDICASLANADPNPKLQNSIRFQRFLSKYAHSKWLRFRPVELWAARSSLLHAYSAFGDYTKKAKARPLFYYAWPEEKSDVEERLKRRGYRDFILVNIQEIKTIALTAFNSLFREVWNDPELAATVAANARDLLHIADEMRLEEFMEWVDAQNRVE